MSSIAARRPTIADVGSPVVRAVATRLGDYLREVDGSRSAFWPLVERIPQAPLSRTLEIRRVRLVLWWAAEVVSPTSAIYLNGLLSATHPVLLVRAERDVRRALTLAAQCAQLDSQLADEAVVRHVWDAVFAAFTHGHTQPLTPMVLPVLRSGHELLRHLVDLPNSTDAALPAWTPVTLTRGGAYAH
jgi:hypothetical protein